MVVCNIGSSNVYSYLNSTGFMNGVICNTWYSYSVTQTPVFSLQYTLCIKSDVGIYSLICERIDRQYQKKLNVQVKNKTVFPLHNYSIIPF